MKFNFKNKFELFTFLAFLLFSVESFSKGKVHREHGAHQHGAGTLSIAFDDTKGRVELKVASESIIGFEHKATKAKDIEIQKKQISSLEQNIASMVEFQSSLNCKFSQIKTEIIFENKKSNHSETQLSADVNCEKTPQGSKLTFNIQKYFPKIKDVDAQILMGSIQKAFEINKVNQVFELN